MIASQAMGSVAGLPLASWLPDRFGRKMAILVGNIIIVGGAIGQTFVHTCVSLCQVCD
jgi:MFS family permease